MVGEGWSERFIDPEGNLFGIIERNISDIK